MDYIILLFYLSLILLLHSYILYPITISFLAYLFEKKYKTESEFKPFVSILISSYNEEQVIAQTIRYLYSSDYPKNKMEILVGSDGSTDETNIILKELMKEIPLLKSFEFSERRGKKFVINDIVQEAKGEILVFCDSNSLYEKNALKNLVKYFADSKVGGVCGRLKLSDMEKNDKSQHQEKKYWDYETWIKSSEGRLGVLIGSNGAIYSIRKELFVPMPGKEPVVDDLYLSLKVLEQEKDFLFSTEAEAEERLATTDRDEFRRKIRILPRSLETLKKTKSLLFTKRILISYCYWSHKVIRWFSPLLLILLFISNLLILSVSNAYLVFGILQIIFYASGLIGFILNKVNIKVYYFELIYYFILTNVALIIGYQKFLFKKHKPFWEPTIRILI